MVTTAARCIQKDNHEGVRIEKNIATGVSTLKPGHFVLVTSANKFNVQATSGGQDPTILLVDDKFQGDPVSGGGVDKAYTADNPAFAEFPPPGALRYVRVATGQTLVKGDQLIFNGAAALIKTTGTPSKIVAISEEAVTTSGEQLVLARIA
jgi:hypothetical protein